jgi:hypothetical protein
VLNNHEARSISLPLDRLGTGFHMTLWRDGATPRETVKEARVVHGALALDLAGSGGAAMILEP